MVEYSYIASGSEAEELLLPFWKEQNYIDEHQPSKKTWGFILKDGDTVIGGVTGFFKDDWCYVKELILEAEYRGKGYGEELLSKAEKHADQHGCIGVYLKTYSYQAVEFYLKCGFEEIFAMNDMPKNHSTHFLQKVF